MTPLRHLCHTSGNYDTFAGYAVHCMVVFQEKAVCPNWVCFQLIARVSVREFFSERPVPASVGLGRTSFGLESCLSTEEVYLLDKRTTIDVKSVASLQGSSSVMAGLRAFHRLEKEVHYFISRYGVPGDFITGGTRGLVPVGKKSVRQLRKAYPGNQGRSQTGKAAIESSQRVYLKRFQRSQFAS